MTKRIPYATSLPLLLVWALTCALVCAPSMACAEEAGSLEAPASTLEVQDEQPSVTSRTRAEYTDKHGNVTIEAPCETLKEAFAFGDIVTVSFLGQSIDVPFCSGYSDVDSGMAALFARPHKDYGELAINMGNFATTYGIAIKHQDESGTITWTCPEGVEEPIEVVITLKEAGGYYDEWVMRQLSYTNERSDYPQLSDDEFANFREVATTGIAPGTLYRCASPVNNKFNRNTYADAAIRGAGVTVVVNLADTEEQLLAFDGYDQTYYATVQHATVCMDTNVTSSENAQKLAEAVRFMGQHPGVYAIHCLEGKDRTGFVLAVLECLMGASKDEVIADYMVTYYNYYGVTPDDARYASIANSNIIKTLERVFGLESLDGVDLASTAEGYLTAIGLTEDEISSLKANLNPTRTVTLTFETGGLGSAPLAQELATGECAVRPADPTAWGFRFAGWYADEARTQEFDFATPLSQDTTLYAKWVKAAAPCPVVIAPSPLRPWTPWGGWVRPFGVYRPNPWYPAPRHYIPVPHKYTR